MAACADSNSFVHDQKASQNSFTKRLSVDISIPKSLLERRGGISFGASSAYSFSKPRFEASF